jgi:predicted nucleotidyltransferase
VRPARFGILFGQPDRRYQGSELIRMANSGTGAVHRQLKSLAASGLVTLTRVGNQRYYQANPDSPVFEELCGLIQKTVGLREPLRAALAPFHDRISVAFVYGSVAKGTDTTKSDIDLMLLSESLTYGDVFAALEETAVRLGRTVNPTVYSPKEFSKRVKGGNAFITRVLAQPKVWLIGDERDLPA